MIVRIDKVFEKDTDKIKDKKILIRIADVIEKVRETDDIISIKTLRS
jgi:hypothetical protein